MRTHELRGSRPGTTSALRPGKAWKNGALSLSFWAINIGLALMVLISLLPIGLMQTWALG
jgi:nitric oxide reductase large subunit